MIEHAPDGVLVEVQAKLIAFPGVDIDAIRPWDEGEIGIAGLVATLLCT
jgi:hypothetical protein